MPITELTSAHDVHMIRFTTYSQLQPSSSIRTPINIDRYLSSRERAINIPATTQAYINEELWIVSDGGTHNGLGYFGCVIATSTSILWEDYGQVGGNAEQMDSLRSENKGTLDATEFLLQLYQVVGKLNYGTRLLHYCDKK